MATLHRMCPLEEPDVDSPVVHHSPTSPVLSDACSIAPLDSSFDNVTESQLETDMEGVCMWLMKLYNHACMLMYSR